MWFQVQISFENRCIGESMKLMMLLELRSLILVLKTSSQASRTEILFLFTSSSISEFTANFPIVHKEGIHIYTVKSFHIRLGEWVHTSSNSYQFHSTISSNNWVVQISIDAYVCGTKKNAFHIVGASKKKTHFSSLVRNPKRNHTWTDRSPHFVSLDSCVWKVGNIAMDVVATKEHWDAHNRCLQVTKNSASIVRFVRIKNYNILVGVMKSMNNLF